MKQFLKYVALYLFHAVFVRPVIFILGGTHIRRRYLVPKGPCIVVANHNSHLDAGILMSMFPFRRLRHVHPVAAADYFGQNAFLSMLAMTLMNGIPIARRSAPGEDPLAPIREALKKGESLIFFPEGSRGEAGVVAPFRTGIGRLVKAFPGLLVVPVFMTGPERIWPRGQLVPVPLNSYANVGKPRTFSPDLDSRVIAERVRKAVMALAPPPPPAPGPRPSPPARVAVCCIESGLRREVFLEVAKRLGKRARTIGLSHPILEADESGVREAAGGIPVTRSRLLPCFLAKAFRTGGWWKGYKFAELVERARIDEALQHGMPARFVAWDGSPLVDLLAWAEADFYKGRFDEKEIRELKRFLSGERRIPRGRWWSFIRRAPEVWLLNVFDLARPPAPDVLVLVELTPQGAMERIRAGGKTLDRYENEEFLAALAEGYRSVAGALEKWSKMSVIRVDAAAGSPAEIAGRVDEACERFVRQNDPAVPAR